MAQIPEFTDVFSQNAQVNCTQESVPTVPTISSRRCALSLDETQKICTRAYTMRIVRVTLGGCFRIAAFCNHAQRNVAQHDMRITEALYETQEAFHVAHMSWDSKAIYVVRVNFIDQEQF